MISANLFRLICAVLTLASTVIAVGKQNAFDTTNEKSVGILNKLPRYEDCSALDGSGVTCNDEINPIGILTSGAVFGVFAILSFLLWPFWCICRCCQCCCCKKTKHNEKVTGCKRWAAYIFVILCCCIMVAFAGIAYDANKRFTEAVVEPNTGLLSVVQTLLHEFTDFAENIVLEPLTFIKSYSIFAIANVSSTLSGNTEVIAAGTVNVDETFGNFSNKWSTFIIVVNSGGQDFVFPCDVCSEIGGIINETRSQLREITDPMLDFFNATVTDINTKLISVNETVVSTVNDVQGQFTDINDMLVEARDDYDDSYRPEAENINDTRELAYEILFAAALVPIIFVVLGGILRKSICFTMAYALMWFVFFVMCLMLFIHLPISVGLNDTCKYIDSHDDDMTEVLGNKTGKLVQACFDDTPIAEVFGMSDDFEFAAIDFGDFNLSEVESALTFDSLDGFLVNLTDIDPLSTFGETVDELLVAVNSLVENCVCTSDGTRANDRYNRTNIFDLDSITANDYYNSASGIPAEVEAYELLNQTAYATQLTVSAETSASAQFDAAVIDLLSDAEGLKNVTQNLKEDVLHFFTIFELVAVILQPLLDKANEIIANGKCGFIGVAYEGFKASMCENILASLSTMVLCMFLICIFSCVSCCLSMKMVRKIDPVMSEEYERRQLFPNGQPQVIIMTGTQQYGHALYAREK
jgi:hypothetical protein